MKVSDILEEQYDDDCVGETIDDMFHDDYADIAGVVGMDFEDLAEMMREIVSKQRDVNFQKEYAVIEKLAQFGDGELFIAKGTDERLDKLHDVINSNADLMTIVKGIQEYVMILNKHTTTRDDWENSPDGEAARRQAEEICSEPSDPYARAGVKPSDFF